LPGELNPQQISVFVILIVAFAILVTERIRNDLVAILIVLALYGTHVLTAPEALAGFSSEPAIVVAAIFVLSCALHQTGLSDKIGGWIGRLAGDSFTRAVAVIMPSVALLSAFTHHVTTTAVMLPVTLNLCRERNIPPSKLLMPMSFAASLGTTITIIGAPAFMIAGGVLQQAGRPGLGVFFIAPIGLTLSAVGTLFMLLVGRFILPAREGGEGQGSRYRLDDYFTELTILPDSPLLDKTVQEVEADEAYQFAVVGWVHNGRALQRPFGERRLRASDVLLVRTTPEEIVAFRQEPGFELQPVHQYQPEEAGGNGQADDVADLVGRPLADVDFRRRYGVIVVSLWRQKGWLGQEMAHIKLRGGDVLVLQGDEEDLDRVADDRAFLLLTPFQGEARLRGKAPLAGAIMLATIVAASLNWVTLEMAGLAGAAAMVLTRCISGRQAYQAIDARIYVFIAGAIPLGAAMQKSGVSALLAGGLQGAVGGWSETLVLLAVFAIVGVATQFMSDSATTALFAPVAVALAQGLDRPPEAYVVTVAMASVVAFLTPIGHHGNLLIYGPGRYQFADFVRVGAPLTVLCALVVALLAPLVWGR
jgi:di/tricarboxylate transporter